MAVLRALQSENQQSVHLYSTRDFEEFADRRVSNSLDLRKFVMYTIYFLLCLPRSHRVQFGAQASLAEPMGSPSLRFPGRKNDNQKYTDRKSTRLNSSHVASSYAVLRSQKKKRAWQTNLSSGTQLTKPT